MIRAKARHYLKHIDLHFQAATGTGDWIQHTGIKKPAGASKKLSKISGAESGAFEVQNAVQHQAAPVCTFSQFGTQPLAPYEVVHGLAIVCKTLQSETMGEEGFEPSKAKPTDLQSVLVDHLSIRPSEDLSFEV